MPNKILNLKNIKNNKNIENECRSDTWDKKTLLYIYIYIYIYTHTHTIYTVDEKIIK